MGIFFVCVPPPTKCYYGKADFKDRILLLNAFILPGVISGLR